MIDQVQSVLDLFKFCGVKSQIPDILVQRPVEITQKIAHFRQLVCQRIQIRINAAHRGKLTGRPVQRLFRAAVASAGPVAGLSGGFTDLSEVLQKAVPVFQFLILAFPNGGLFDLFQLIRKKIRFPLAGRIIQVILLPLFSERFPFSEVLRSGFF